MSNQPVQDASNKGDKAKITGAVVASIAGVVGFYFFSDKPTLTRASILLVGVFIAAIFVWYSSSGRNFLVFARESARETKRVVWPTRRDTLRVTGVVFAFAVMMAVFLWGADTLLEFVLYNLILGWKR